MAERGLRVLDASGVVILLSSGPELEVVAEAGDAHPRARTFPSTGSALGQLFANGAGASLERPGAREAPWLAELGLDRAVSVLAEPVPVQEQPGLVVAIRTGEPPFLPRDAAAAQDLARTLSDRLEAERSSERERLRHGVRARELERARWARELHDETVQDLGALRLLLAGARDQHDVGQLRGTIEAAIGHVDREVEGLRHLITALRPAALDDLGLVSALEALARRASAIDGLTVQTDIALDSDVPRLEPEVESAVYRVVQEALTNTAKHAGATRVVLALRLEDDRLTATVSDDGNGFDLAAGGTANDVGPGHGVGLDGMRERAHLVGADLTIDSSLGAGTTVRVSVPVHAAGADQSISP
jgi:two-component system, NarL family, sensor histidine kinase DevS